MFAVAGVAKIADPGSFQLAVEDFRLVGRPFAYGIALMVPLLEVVIACALLTARFRVAAWILTVPLSLGFLVFIGSASIRGLDVSCGCFGTVGSDIGVLYWIRAGGILVIALYELRMHVSAVMTEDGR